MWNGNIYIILKNICAWLNSNGSKSNIKENEGRQFMHIGKINLAKKEKMRSEIFTFKFREFG